MMKRYLLSVVLGSLMILGFAGGPDAFGLQAADVKGVPPAAPAVGTGAPGATAAPAAAAVVPAAPAYQYSTAGKPDPFKPYMETDPAVKKRMEEEQQKKAAMQERPISPLQQAELGRFRLVGIAGDQERRAAIVEDGVAKKYYPLFVGTYIGLNGGRVAAILSDRVVVEEKTEKQAPKGQMRRMTVMLHKEEEGKP